MLKLLDFWFADFSWYRKLTENSKTEWMRKEIESHAGIQSEWLRLPKGTYIMLQAVNQMVEDYPNIKDLTDAQKRDIIQNYLDKYYGKDEEMEEDLG